jgi:Domain of unknown function (DUF4267)
MTPAAIAFAVLACVTIAAIGLRFLVRPTAATRDFGVQPDDARALTAIKGVRDITSGVVPMVVWAVAGVPALGWALIAASITPWADMGIVLARHGRRTAAFGIHGLTATLLVAAGAVLVASG